MKVLIKSALAAATLFASMLIVALPALALEPGDPLPGDLQLRMTASPNPVAAGGALAYTLTITNPTASVRVCDPMHKPNTCRYQQQGQSYTGVTLQQTLPSNVTFQSVTASNGFACSVAMPVLSCSNGSVAMNATATLVVNVLVPNSGTTLSSSASVSAGGYDERSYTNNSAGISTTVSPRSANGVFNPNSVDFGNQGTGTSSAVRTVTFSNPGELPMTITSKYLSNPSGGFSATDNCPSILAGGASCAFQIVFSPTAVGAAPNTLVVSDDGPGGSQSLAITGNGVGPIASLSTTSIDFGQVEAGIGAGRQITLTNTGLGILHVTATTASANFYAWHDCPTDLLAGASCTVNASFSPSGPGTFNGGLSVIDDAPGGTQSVGLHGVAFIPNLSSTAQQITPATPGGVVSYLITVHNDGTTPATASGISFRSTYDYGAFVRSSQTTAPFACNGTYADDGLPWLVWSCTLPRTVSIPPGGSATLTLDVQLPTTSGGYTAAICTLIANGWNLTPNLSVYTSW